MLLIALGGPPQQNVVSLLVGDPHLPDKTFCPVLTINSRREVKKFPSEVAAGWKA